MKILFVVPYVPSLVRVRPYNLLKFLAARGHQITLATVWTTEQERDDLAALSPFCHDICAAPLPRWRSLLNSAVTLAGREPLQSAFSWQPALARRLSDRVTDEEGQPQFDAIHVEHLRGARYALSIKEQLAALPSDIRPAVVWDSVDCISLLFRQAAEQSRTLFGRFLTRLELPRTERYEAWLARQFDRVLLTSPLDRDAYTSLLERLAPGERGGNFAVIPNGVDLDYFKPVQDVKRDPQTVVISGKMSYHANVTMVLFMVNEVMPRIWRHRPEVQLVVVGKDPARAILASGEQHPNVTVTGTVPDIRPFLREATISIAPIIYGVGIQNKVLEAMACGTPVVASSRAVSAIAAQPGRDLLVGDGAAPLAEAVLSLLADADKRRQIGEQGRRFVEQKHNWATIAAQVESLYGKCISKT